MLLMVLAVMVLVVTVLAALSSLSMNSALAAADAQVRLQQRVGVESLERILLPNAASIFEDLEKAAEASGQRVQPNLRTAVSTGGMTFDVILADENAKLNLNEVFLLVGADRLRTAIGEVSGPEATRAMRLVPSRDATEANRDADTQDDDSEEVALRAFRSWGEVFDLQLLADSFGNDAALPNVTTELTCWGGALNVQRASDRALGQTVAGVLSGAAADRFVTKIRENPPGSIEILIQKETASESQRRSLRRLLSETSNQFSLWIDASSVNRRSSRTFSVLRTSEDGTTINERFAF